MKLLSMAIALVVLSGCTSARSWTIGHPTESQLSMITSEVKEHLNLHPPDLEFQLMVLDSIAEVRKQSIATFNVDCKCEGYYSGTTKTIVVSKTSPIHILRHELAHAIVNQYFKMPVPRWLHEMIAEYAE